MKAVILAGWLGTRMSEENPGVTRIGEFLGVDFQ